jgi:hypothetical protein
MFLMKNWFEWDGGEGMEGNILYALPVKLHDAVVNRARRK